MATGAMSGTGASAVGGLFEGGDSACARVGAAREEHVVGMELVHGGGNFGDSSEKALRVCVLWMR